MNVSIIIPVQASEVHHLPITLAGVFAQNYQKGRTEVILVGYGASPPPDLLLPPRTTEVRTLTTESLSPYAARNLAAARATGDVLLFTEPGCIPDAGWVREHVRSLCERRLTVSVGQVAPARLTPSLQLFLSYEGVRDAWVFSCPHPEQYLGRPKNMAISRSRFETHGPFAEVMRGADSKLVQLIARAVSCDEVGLTPTAVIRQGSINGLPTCLADRFRRGYALRKHRSNHAGAISLKKRKRLFRETLRQREYGFVRATWLFVLLAVGVFAFRSGSWAAAVNLRAAKLRMRRHI